MNVYIVYFNLGSSYPEFSVVVAETALDAVRVVVKEEVLWSDDQYITDIERVDLEKEQLIETATFCC